MSGIPFCLFPKLYRGSTTDALAAAVLQAGLDGCALLVRDGYWCEPATAAAEAPRFIAAMRSHGLAVPYAVVPHGPEDLARDPTPLRILADAGIPLVRIGYLPAGPDPRLAFARGRRAFADLAASALRIGIRVVLQLHHQTLHASPTAAWALVGELPARAVGVKLDPGNQQHEGWEDPARSIALLADHVAAVGVKDVALRREADGSWTKPWAPAGEGIIDWSRIVAPLVARGFDGPFVLSPFHHEHDAAARTGALAREVRHLHSLVRAARASAAVTASASASAPTASRT